MSNSKQGPAEPDSDGAQSQANTHFHSHLSKKPRYLKKEQQQKKLEGRNTLIFIICRPFPKLWADGC